MNKERLEDLIDVLSRQYSEAERKLVIRTQEQLLAYSKNPEQWRNKQMSNRGRFKSQLLTLGKQELRKLNDVTDKIMLVIHNELVGDTVEMKTLEVSRSIIASAERLQSENARNMAELLNASNAQHLASVRIVSALAKPDELYDAIRAQTVRGISRGAPITTASGRTYSWGTYMEMRARTDLQREVTDQAILAGTAVGQIFYACDSYADCAPDHVDYQGRVYYNADADIPSDVQAYIDSEGIMSMQEVRDAEPWLTTRPNCRHQFHAVPLESVMSEKNVTKQFERGKYKGSNYEKMQEQRSNERAIRKYKTRTEQFENLYHSTGDPYYLKRAKQSERAIGNWQAKQRELIQANPTLLKREYVRESVDVIKTDFGAKYDLKMPNDDEARRNWNALRKRVRELTLPNV